MSAEPLLQVNDLHVHFPTPDGLVKAVDGVSFTLERGTTLGVVGESGSGKERLLHDGDGPHQPQDGEGRAARSSSRGRTSSTLEAIRAPAAARATPWGMVFQDPLTSLHPMYRVGRPDLRGRARPPAT